MLAPAPSLDGKYSIFGKVVDGFDTLEKMEKIQRGPDGQTPVEKIELSRLLSSREGDLNEVKAVALALVSF